jgi:hypothetical protein
MSDHSFSGEDIQSGMQLLLDEVVGDHDGWEDEVEQMKSRLGVLARDLMTSYMTLRSLPSSKSGAVKVRFFTQSRRMKEEWMRRRRQAGD